MDIHEHAVTARIRARQAHVLVQIEAGPDLQQALAIGLVVPDPDLVWNEEREHYDFGEIDWTEFERVISGNGPCNRQRLAHHIQAHEEGAWVREAMAAYEAKRKGRATDVA